MAQAVKTRRGVDGRAAGPSVREIRAIITLSGGERAARGRAETAAMPSTVRADDRATPPGLSSGDREKLPSPGPRTKKSLNELSSR